MTQPSAGRRLDWGLLILVIVASQGLSAFLPGKPIVTTIVLSTVIMVFYCIREPSRAFSVVFSSPLVLFFSAWSFAAALLHPQPASALLQMGVPILMIVYSSIRQNTVERTLQAFALGATFSLVPSIVGLIAPIFGPVRRHAGSAGGYAGYFPWNSAAGLCAAAALLTVCLLFLNSGFAWWHVPAAAAALLMLVVSKSATAMLAFGVAMVVLVGKGVLRRFGAGMRTLVMVVFGTAGILLAPIIIDYLNLSTVGEVAGRTASLSGRTTVWRYTFDGISASPYWGHGPGVFWERFGGWPSSAHNGFLDFALTAGLPASLAICAIVIVAGLRLAMASSPLFLLVVFGAVANITVSQLSVPGIASLALWLAVGATARAGKSGASVGGSASASHETAQTIAARPLRA